MTEQDIKHNYPILFSIMEKDDQAKNYLSQLLEGKISVLGVYERILLSLALRSEKLEKLIAELTNQVNEKSK